MKKYILYFLLGVLLLFLIHKVKEYRNNSPVLIGDKHDASQLLTFSSSDIPFSKKDHGLSYSISIWSYVKSWDSDLKQKEILNWVDNMLIYYNSRRNTINFRIKLLDGNFEEYYIKGITLQKWNNIVVVVNNRYVDIFINGTLMRSVYLKTLPNYKRNIVNVCSNGGYNGYLTNLRFFNYPIGLFSINYMNSFGPKIPNILNFLFKIKPRTLNLCN